MTKTYDGVFLNKFGKQPKTQEKTYLVDDKRLTAKEIYDSIGLTKSQFYHGMRACDYDINILIKRYSK